MSARAQLRLACGLALLAACDRSPTATQSPSARPAGVLVFAAASLAAPLERIASEFEAAHPATRITLNFAGTPELVMQVREGARADVFASADEPNMQQLVESRLVAGDAAAFARNRLTIAVAKGNPKRIATLADLARSELRVVLCAPQVPAGRYAREACAKAGVTVEPASDEPNVKAALGKVELGEADAAIVYVTDVAGAASRVDAVGIPEPHNVVAKYPIALLAHGAGNAAARAFVDHVTGPAGRRVLASFGFDAP